jgi:hypothetical protein
METIKKDGDVKAVKKLTKDEEISDLEEKLILCFKSWTINTAFISATFATLLGLSMSFLMVVAYSIIERVRGDLVSSSINPVEKEELDNIIYILGIGAWSVWAWVFAYLILFIVFMVPKSTVGYWILWIAYMACGIIILITASMGVARLNKYEKEHGDQKINVDGIISAKYVCTVTIFISAFFVFLVLTVGLTLLCGTDAKAAESIRKSM